MKNGYAPNSAKSKKGRPQLQWTAEAASHQPSPSLYSGQLCTILQARKNQGEIMRGLANKVPG